MLLRYIVYMMFGSTLGLFIFHSTMTSMGNLQAEMVRKLFGGKDLGSTSSYQGSIIPNQKKLEKERRRAREETRRIAREIRDQNWRMRMTMMDLRARQKDHRRFIESRKEDTKKARARQSQISKNINDQYRDLIDSRKRR